MSTDITLGGGTKPLDTQMGGDGNPLAIDTTSTVHTPDVMQTDTTLHTPDVMQTDVTLHTPDVMRTDSTSRSDIKADSRMLIDLKPMVVDMCTTLNFGKMPETCVRQPYEHRFCFTLFGIEVMAFEMRGESRTYTESMPDRPAVVWGGEGVHRTGRDHEWDERDGGRHGLVIPI
jgi:hypothetical protein